MVKRLRVDELKEGDKLKILFPVTDTPEEVVVVEVQEDGVIIECEGGYRFGLVTINGTEFASSVKRAEHS